MILGPFVMCVGSYLPFQTTYYLNGHHFIAGELDRQGIRFQRDDNAFLSVADPVALQAAANRLTADVIRKRLDYWTRVLGPKFSRGDRAAVHPRREYSLNQVEYSLNFVTHGRMRIPGIKIHDTRMIRLMEVLLHAGPSARWLARKRHPRRAPVDLR
jgi:hypothetical protein